MKFIRESFHRVLFVRQCSHVRTQVSRVDLRHRLLAERGLTLALLEKPLVASAAQVRGCRFVLLALVVIAINLLSMLIDGDKLGLSLLVVAVDVALTQR